MPLVPVDPDLILLTRSPSPRPVVGRNADIKLSEPTPVNQAEIGNRRRPVPRRLHRPQPEEIIADLGRSRDHRHHGAVPRNRLFTIHAIALPNGTALPGPQVSA